MSLAMPRRYENARKVLAFNEIVDIVVFLRERITHAMARRANPSEHLEEIANNALTDLKQYYQKCGIAAHHDLNQITIMVIAPHKFFIRILSHEHDIEINVKVAKETRHGKRFRPSARPHRRDRLSASRSDGTSASQAA